ncbi:MAG TPA: TlpA disulfide reductase family protein [Polyangia bacterium]|jgi:thiol-disulfide isomerase/thioredoxin|nr:TlpA disulfide reductase family protein [Polyangia bacterium]
MDQGRPRLELARSAAAVLLLLSFGCATTGAEGGGTGGPVGAPLPALTVDALSGRAINVASYKGRVLLLDVWASWCDPCKQELPVLNEMARRLKSQGIDILAVSVDQERANVEKFLRAHGGRWALTVAHDPRGEIAELLQPDKMPTSYVIDRSGIVRYVNAGFLPGDASTIEQHLLEVAGH